MIDTCYQYEMLGVQGYDAFVKLFKSILLGQWYNLSDSELERRLLVRLDFLYFYDFEEAYIAPHKLALEFALPLFSENSLVISDRSTIALTTKMLRSDLSQLVLLKKTNIEDSLERFIRRLGVVTEYW